MQRVGFSHNPLTGVVDQPVEPEATVLTCIRNSEEYKYIASNKTERRETDIFMLSLYDRARGRLYCRGTPSIVVSTIELYTKKGDFSMTDKCYYYYRHGDSPEATYITVEELYKYLKDTVLPQFDQARRDLTAPRDKKDDDTPDVAEWMAKNGIRTDAAPDEDSYDGEAPLPSVGGFD